MDGWEDTSVIAADEGSGDAQHGDGAWEDGRALDLQVGSFEGGEEDDHAALGVGAAPEVDGDAVGRRHGGEGRQVDADVPELVGQFAVVVDDDLLRAALLDGVDDLHADHVALVRLQDQTRFHLPVSSGRRKKK